MRVRGRGRDHTPFRGRQSEGNQKAIRRQSEGNQKAIRRQSEGNQMGVTFGISPSSRFALAYMALISGHLAERPS